ncbi:MAG: hypothetical protein WCT28_00445 [Patescibacteria group bacterium]|jgi:hypothetical protein
MKVVSTTVARKNIKQIIDEVRHENEVFVVGRHSHHDAIIIRFPEHYNKSLSDITNINANSSSFDFLKDEPDLYSRDDVKEAYV